MCNKVVLKLFWYFTTIMHFICNINLYRLNFYLEAFISLYTRLKIQSYFSFSRVNLLTAKTMSFPQVCLVISPYLKLVIGYFEMLKLALELYV